jgi:hypothetical protein
MGQIHAPQPKNGFLAVTKKSRKLQSYIKAGNIFVDLLSLAKKPLFLARFLLVKNRSLSANFLTPRLFALTPKSPLSLIAFIAI